MSFTWKSEPGKLIRAEHINEVRININTLLTDLGLPLYSWDKVPVNKDDLVNFEVLEEIRNATDYSEDENYCHTHNVTQNSLHRTSHFGTYRNNVETGNDATDHLSYNNNRDTGHQSNNNTSVRATPHRSIHNTGYYITYRSNHDATRRDTHHSYYCTNFNASVK